MKPPSFVPMLIIIVCMIVATSSAKAADTTDVIRVNNFWNTSIKYAVDDTVHGKDHWQGPGESWMRKTGDCDDYALAKYYTLLAVGVPEKDLKLAGVVYNNGTAPVLHIVVLLTDSRGTWVLDNADPEVALLSQRPDIISTLATYDNAGVKWHAAIPKAAHTPALWAKMRSNRTKHIADARAAYTTRPITVTWVR